MTSTANKRNSFFWNDKQYKLLPAPFRDQLEAGQLDPSLLRPADCLIARQRHWLKPVATQAGQIEASEWLSLERAPSPDGLAQGLITWYDYEGKANGDASVQGHSLSRSFEAWTLPNGEPRFIHYRRNSLGNLTQTIETWSSLGGEVALRTNAQVYADNEIDVVSVINAQGVQIVKRVYNDHHQVRAEYNALNEMTAYTYDDAHRLTSMRNPAGLTTTNVYGPDGYLFVQINPEINRTNTYTWADGLIHTHSDPRGLTVTNTWDALNRLTKVTYPDGTRTAYVYDKLDLVMTIDRLGQTNRAVYNGIRQRIESIDALGRSTTYTYCNCGELESVTDPLNRTTMFFYDQAGRSIATCASGSWMNSQYDASGRLISTVDSTGMSLTNWYNNQGRVVAVSNAFGRVQAAQLDILDRATWAVDRNNVPVQTEYDRLGRAIVRLHADGGVESYGYSPAGLAAHTNQLGHITQYEYDCAGRRIAEWDANTHVLRFAFSPAGDLVAVTDAEGQTTRYEYDLFGRMVGQIDAAGRRVTEYKYDAGNRVIERTTAAKGATYYQHDAAGNLVSVAHPVSPSIRMDYDACNHLIKMADGVGTSEYSYDDQDRLVREDGPWADDTVTYAYAGDARVGLALLQPNQPAWRQTYPYDAGMRVTKVVSPAGEFQYAYDALRMGKLAAVSFPNGIQALNAYDERARLVSIQIVDPSQAVLDGHSYAFDKSGLCTEHRLLDGDYLAYTYDDIGQLSSVRGALPKTDPDLSEVRFGYQYNAAGSLVGRTIGSQVETFSVNSLQQITGSVSTPPAKPPGSGQAVVARPVALNRTYDLNGNLIGDGIRQFEYDDENQLVRITWPNLWKSEFKYDGKMRRRVLLEFAWSKAGQRWELAHEVRYVYDGHSVLQERDLNNMPILTYTWGQDQSGEIQGAGGIGGLLARTRNSITGGAGAPPASVYYHSDGMGNIGTITMADGLVAANYVYEPFGGALAETGPLAGENLYRYSTKEIHPNSGLYYYGYRFYDPNLQRWLNRDPIGENGGFNLYRFVGNNPIGQYDYLGLLHYSLCSNTSSSDEYALVGRVWVLVSPGGSAGGWSPDGDCDGMTCKGGFYQVQLGGNCSNGGDWWPFTHLRWTPSDKDTGSVSPPGRGSSQGDTPPGYTYNYYRCRRQ